MTVGGRVESTRVDLGGARRFMAQARRGSGGTDIDGGRGSTNT